ncbi:VOC family protein [Umezawaea sp. NPDC059074]|uniref:VOC family protein n=1 Tax=Umezawaea sp. NPDC059074 TaxID=3346716 RepID=UPI00367C4AAB
MRCSHVLLKVDDLHRAVRDFRDLGFVVDYASAERKARHAHIWFASGPIVEILTTPPGARFTKWPLDLAFGRGSGARMTRWARSEEGFCDAALLADDLDLPDLGRKVGWTRTKPDGSTTRFSFAYPRNERVPFLVTPYDPPQHPAAITHPNGATGVSRVHVDIGHVDRAVFDRLVGPDDGFATRPADTTRVRAVELAGLTRALDPALLHGAVVLAP